MPVSDVPLRCTRAAICSRSPARSAWMASNDGLASRSVGAGGVQDIAAGTAPTDLDAFAEAQMLSANVGAQLTAFVTNPATALVLAQMKEATGSASRCSNPTPPSRPAG